MILPCTVSSYAKSIRMASDPRALRSNFSQNRPLCLNAVSTSLKRKGHDKKIQYIFLFIYLFG